MRDKVLALLLALFAAGATWQIARQWPPALRQHVADEVWFEADVPRVYDNITHADNDQDRSQVHPLFGLLTIPLLRVMSVDAWLASIAALWALLLFAVLRTTGTPSYLSATLTLTGLASASALFFLTVPESYALGSVTILAALFLILRGNRITLASALSLSITVTNWFVGLAAAFLFLPFRKAVQKSINAFFVVTLLWTFEKALAPETEFFTAVTREKTFSVPLSPLRIAQVATTFFCHSLVLPSFSTTTNYGDATGPQYPVGSPQYPRGLTVQRSWPGSPALLVWIPLVMLGIRHARGRLRLLTIFLAAEFALHSIYGVETFMYSLNWLPVLIVLFGLGTMTLPRRFQWPPTLLALGLTVLNNYQAWQGVQSFLKR